MVSDMVGLTPHPSPISPHKNPDHISWQDGARNDPDIIICPNPFSKQAFLESVLEVSDCDTIYLDFDLLYSGYVSSGMIKPPETLLVRRPGRNNWNAELTDVLRMISQKRYLVILDSLNTLNILWGRSGSRRLAISSVMLMSSLGRKTDTHTLVAAVGRRTKDGWELLPGGRLMAGLNARAVP